MQQTSVPDSQVDEEADSHRVDPSQQSPARVSATSIATTATTTVRIWNHARLWSAGGRYEERDYAVGPGAVTGRLRSRGQSDHRDHRPHRKGACGDADRSVAAAAAGLGRGGGGAAGGAGAPWLRGRWPRGSAPGGRRSSRNRPSGERSVSIDETDHPCVGHRNRRATAQKVGVGGVSYLLSPASDPSIWARAGPPPQGPARCPNLSGLFSRDYRLW